MSIPRSAFGFIRKEHFSSQMNFTDRKVWGNGTILISVKSIWYKWGLQHGTDCNKLPSVCSVFWNGLNLSFYCCSIMLMSYKITFCCCWKVKREYQFLYIELGSISAVSCQGLITLTEDIIHIKANFQGLCNDKFS